MSKKIREIAVLAAKNIFTRGTTGVRIRRLIIFFGIYFLLGSITQHLTFTLLVNLGFPVSIDFVYVSLFQLLILFILFWFWELLLLSRFKNPIKIKSVLLERIYLCVSIPVFLIAPFSRGGRHGAELFSAFMAVAWFLMLTSGLVMAVTAASEKRPVMSVILTATALILGVGHYLVVIYG